jgi:Lon protease-like protein
MDIHTDIGDFSGRCRLFPLPNVVLFPHVILPLHIFEPRYRQMTRDALDGDQLITVVQIRPLPEGQPWVEPVPIMDVACVGKVVQHERLADGRFNILLLGCKRVRLDREVATETLYRVAEATVLADEAPAEESDPRRDELIALFLDVLQMNDRLDAELSQLLHSDLPMGVLTDIVAHAMVVPASIKQTLLDETRVDLRVAKVLHVLREVHGRRAGSRHFPPPFSLN